MSISQTTPEDSTIQQHFCPQCNTLLPPRATFCGSCGERVKTKERAVILDEQDLNDRYRITALVRRRPHVNLYFAQDTLQSTVSGQARMVAIRDIEIAGLEPKSRTEVLALAQQEYDRLRRWHMPHILKSMELRVFQEHLFLISGIPLPPRDNQSASRLYTLQDFLQSGQGLPKETRVLAWLRSLCQVVERLHRQHIILGDLDPYTVVLNKNCAEAEPRLMIFWVQPEIQQLLPQPTEASVPSVSYFSAPEALQGEAEVRSDVYSLGALLYLLLTGTPPDESTLRSRRRLRSPRELNTRISAQLDECVMQALAVKPQERFDSVAAFMAAQENSRLHVVSSKQPGLVALPQEANEAEAETVRIIPLSQADVMRWRAAREQVAQQQAQQAQLVTTATPPPQAHPDQANDAANTSSASDPVPTTPCQEVRGTVEAPPVSVPIPTTPYPENVLSSLDMVEHEIPASTSDASAVVPKPAWSQRITGMLPALKQLPLKPANLKRVLMKSEQAVTTETEPPQAKPQLPEPKEATDASENSLLKQVQQLLMGQHHHAIEAAAIIETPARVRPDQAYHLRLHMMGRDEPAPHPNAKKGALPAGLSAFAHGEALQVEVRSILQHGYTYLLQHAVVTVPARGYAAEVLVPMQPHPQVGVVSGHRERLYVYFLDSQRRPIYEKPFVVEVFVSPLVRPGREGHQVLTIPF